MGGHNRQSHRLRSWDYSQPCWYFNTINVQDRQSLFGEVIDGEVHLSDWGRIVREQWEEIPIHFSGVRLGAYVIMPDHFHGIIIIMRGGWEASSHISNTKPRN
jgi:putative transposase